MRATTKAIHATVVELGRRLGFEPLREVAGTVLSLRLEAAYQPRADVLWSLPLTVDQANALAAVSGGDAGQLRQLPVVGVEIEGTSPTTKTMGADVANIAALGTRFGLLIVSEAGESGIYRRAARAIRSLRRSFGDFGVVPIEASWLEDIGAQSWAAGPSTVTPPKRRAPAGGESLEWSARTREYLRRVGHDAGFVIAEPYTPELLDIVYAAERSRRARPLDHLHDPVSGTSVTISKSAEYLTACQVDLAWLLPLPRAFGEFLGEVAKRDPHLRDHGLLYPELCGHVAVAGFELESGGGKHAAGGLLNLAAYCVLGIGVSPTEAAGSELEGILARYRPTLGLRNVRVLVHA